MAKDTYDAIVIGAGHNGLTLAIYLQRAGLSTLVVEQAARIGGMSRTDEPVPGFHHNPHANILSYYDLMPMVRDFDLEAHGLRTIIPEAQHGVCFSDGRPPLILHRADLRARTQASLARYSPRDAETFCALSEEVDALGPLLADGMYAPARRAWFRRQADVVSRIGGKFGIAGTLGTRSAQALIDDLFETPELRTLLYQLAAEFGVRLEEVGGDLSLLGVVLWIVGRWRLPIGGMRAVPDALGRVAESEGVHLALEARVTKLDVLNGRIRSIFAPGLGRIRANRLVASSAGLVTTLLGLVGANALSRAETSDLRAFAATPPSTLASLMFCLREPPVYRSGRWDPEINRCFHTVMGFDAPEDVLSHLRAVELGRLAAPAAAIRVNTLWDSSQAPEGLHVAGADALMPSHRSLQPDEWRVVRDTYNAAFLERWAAFAPNMTRENVIADQVELPGDYDRKMRFREGAAQYRTEVRGLYLCGASTYPGGGVHGACGYNAYQAIADDLGLASPSPSAAR